MGKSVLTRPDVVPAGLDGLNALLANEQEVGWCPCYLSELLGSDSISCEALYTHRRVNLCCIVNLDRAG